MCAGVQKVSRPIEMCHEMSQYAPKADEVAAAARHHTYHGIAAVRVDSTTGSATRMSSRTSAAFAMWRSLFRFQVGSVPALHSRTTSELTRSTRIFGAGGRLHFCPPLTHCRVTMSKRYPCH